ncbi:MAG: putative hydrolase, partial [Frankiales bacterium]|nr:putative hydrolase [Frankiales bacterium]
MPTVLGADGCPGNGWVVAEVSGAALRWHHVVGAEALAGLADRLGAQAVAVDVPIGLPETGVRACDVQARALLRGGGASSVFAAPTRPALAERTYARARAAVPSLSAQSFALAERIRDADEHVAMDPRFAECHPEGAFRILTGR